MKLNIIRRCAAIMALTMSLCAASLGGATTYYVNAALGNDANAGTSRQSPFRTLERASALSLKAGDQVLLAAGQKFAGELIYEGLAGDAGHPIVISSYPAAASGGEDRATLDAKGCLAGVCLRNCTHVEIGNLLITANGGGMKPAPAAKQGMRCGVLIEADEPGKYEGFSVTNVVVKDVFFEAPGFVRGPQEVKSDNGTQNYGWGIRFLVKSAGAMMRDINITDCQMENVSHTGLKFTAPGNGLQHLEVRRVRTTRTGGPGVQMSGVLHGHFSQLDVNGSGSGDDSRKWGRGSGLWTWGSTDVVIEKSRFQNANGPGDSAGVHVDYNCRNVIVQHNFSAHNAGGFCEILGNNHNCAYRYNVSVNDGYRVKGQNGAMQEGKTFWLSGYVGKGKRVGPFDTYFYNNTIYVGDGMVAKVSVAPTASGVLIANNIFCFEGHSESVLGDQKRANARGTNLPNNVIFESNLYLHPGNWPAGSLIQDKSPSFGDPEFQNAGGLNVADYVPRNAALVQAKGIRIPQIPQDEVGLAGGLDVDQDILGHKISGRPDLGAIQTTKSFQQAKTQ